MIVTAKDISRQLADRADAFARWFLPNGHKEGGNWCVGSIGGEAGSSLKVQVTGSNAGVWADFAGDDRGDMLDLIAAVKGVQLAEAIKTAKEWLGISEPRNVVPQRTYSKPKVNGIVPLKVESPVLAYLAEERRIDVFTQEDYRIFQYNSERFGPAIAFPYYAPDKTTLMNVKYLALKRDEKGKKIIHQEKGCAPCLFGWQTVPESAREIILTEGEIDAMTWHQVGFPAMSIPDGAKGDSWIEVEWDNLQRFDTIYLNWDNDEEGIKAVHDFARRLGYHRCLIVTIAGSKDANEALQRTSDPSPFTTAISSAKPLTPQEVKNPDYFYERVLNRIHPPSGRPPGFYSVLFDGKFGMRPGEVTVWSGIAGHGKSALLCQLLLESMRVGFRCAIASMEMVGDRTLQRMVLQAERNTSISHDDIRKVLDWMTGKLWLYDLLGNVNPAKLLGLMEYSFSRHGVQIFAIDSLMKCAVGQEDYDGQRTFLNTLCAFAEDTGTHVNLVAHSRKRDDEHSVPGKMDVLGSSSIINLASNIFVVCRNKKKEELLRECDNNHPKWVDLQKQADAVIYCNKQRENGTEFRSKLWHEATYYRFDKWGKDVSKINLSVLNGESQISEPDALL